MNTDIKDEIRQRINAATGGDIGEVHPEFFTSADRAPTIHWVDNTLCKFPHWKMILVAATGKTFEIGDCGCN